MHYEFILSSASSAAADDGIFPYHIVMNLRKSIAHHGKADDGV